MLPVIKLGKALKLEIIQTVRARLCEKLSVGKVVGTLFLGASNVVHFAHVVDSASFLVLKQFLLLIAIKFFKGFFLSLESLPGVNLIVIGVSECLLELMFFVELINLLVFDINECLFMLKCRAVDLLHFLSSYEFGLALELLLVKEVVVELETALDRDDVREG